MAQFDWIKLRDEEIENCICIKTIFEGPNRPYIKPKFWGYEHDTARSQWNALDEKITRIDALKIFEFHSATVIGGIAPFFIDGHAIHHMHYDPSVHTCPAEVIGVLHNNKRGILTLFAKKRPIEIEKAISLVGQCNKNYAHFLTETLPRLAIFDADTSCHDWPILIDGGLPKNMVDAVKIMNRSQRKIIFVDQWQPVKIQKLKVTSSIGYEPYVPESLLSIAHEPYFNEFSSGALDLLRTTINKNFSERKGIGKRKVFLSRGNKSYNCRELVNEKTIENILREHDFSILKPYQMTFSQQVEECSVADIIVAPVGASLANMIFAPKGCEVIILSPYYNDASYYYFSNLGSALGHNVSFILGRQNDSNIHPSQKKYSIEIYDLIKILGLQNSSQLN